MKVEKIKCGLRWVCGFRWFCAGGHGVRSDQQPHAARTRAHLLPPLHHTTLKRLSKNYRGVLGDNVVTIATLLEDSGYHTYMAGKWHLGSEPNKLPSSRGFERTVALMDSGADNWEQRPYLPIYEQANWFADGERFSLPDDFYSSRFLIDKTIEFIDSSLDDGKPFFAYVPFQAVHIPVQAPKESTEKYLGVYDEGWSKLREARHQKAIDLGLVSSQSRIQTMPWIQDWSSLSDETK